MKKSKDGMVKEGSFLTTTLIYLILVFFLLVALVPILIMWFTAFRPANEIILDPFSLPEHLTFQNIVDAWVIGKMNIYFLNSIIVIIPRVAGVLVLATMAGYGFAKLRFVFRDGLFFFLLCGMMIPFQAIMIPLYYNMQHLGLINTRLALILPVFGLSMPFAVFFMRAFFRDVPDELMDSARIDGAGAFRTFASIMLPLTLPAVGTLLVFEFMWGWNDFMLPLLTIYKDKLRTLPLGIMYYRTRYTTNFSLVAAGVTISSLPIIIIYMIFQKKFVQGLTAGAIKG